jgi:hypothetical protein
MNKWMNNQCSSFHSIFFNAFIIRYVNQKLVADKILKTHQHITHSRPFMYYEVVKLMPIMLGKGLGQARQRTQHKWALSKAIM